MRGYFFLSILSQRLLGTRLALHRDLGQLWGGGAARRPRLYFLSVLLFAVALLFGGYPAQAAQVAQTVQAAQAAQRAQMAQTVQMLPAVQVAQTAQAAQAAQNDRLPVPELSDWVVDEAQLLSASQQKALAEMLQQFQEQKGAQIFILTVPTLEGEDIESFTLRVFEAWGVGRQSIDDGVLIVVAADERQMRIEVGYGLEGAVPDILAGRIIREQMGPAFQQQAYAQGLMAATTELMRLIDAESLAAAPDQLAADADDDRPEGIEVVIIVVILFVFAFLIPPVPAAVAVGLFIYTIFSSLGWASIAAMVAFLLSAAGSLWRYGPDSDTRYATGSRRRSGRHHSDGGWGGGGFGGGMGGGMGGGGASGSW